MKRITKKSLKAYLREMLTNDDRWVLRALSVIYSFQTRDEQLYESTSVENMVGFTGCDAPFLTSLAKQYEKRSYLSSKQMTKLHKIMPKYWRQLLDASDRDKLENSYMSYLEIKGREKEQDEFDF